MLLVHTGTHKILSVWFWIALIIIFAFILSVFQDKGYTMDSANVETGIISASANKKNRFAIFVRSGS